MRDLAVQASSDTNSQTERDNINLELGQLGKEINSISMRSKFNGQSLLSGSLVKEQVTGTTGYLTGAAEMAVSTTALAAAVTVSAISVDGAQSGKGFVITDASDTNGNYRLMATMVDTNGAAVTMTDANGHTTNVSQTIDVSDIASGESETLNFANLGVKVTLASADTNGTAAAITGAFAAGTYTSGTFSVDTKTASGTATLQTGANQGDETAVSFVNTSLAGGTGVKAMDTLAATLLTFATNGTRDNASSLITALDNALGSISSSRATLGAAQNRLQHTIANLGTTSENLSASNSRIRDVDVATESSNMAKNQVLEQAGVSVLAQANQLPQLALKLLG